MGWKQLVRSANAAARRSERAALRRHRELIKAHQRQAKVSQQQRAADEAKRFENYLALLATVHLDCGEAPDWKALLITPAPAEPVWVESESREAIARSALASYRPSFLGRILGQGKRTIAQLEAAVRDAIVADRQDRERALAAHRRALEVWSTHTRLAQSVLRLELNACRAALEQAEAFDELRALKATVYLETVEQTEARLVYRISDVEVIPRNEVTLTAGGKLSTRDMGVTRYWSLFKDHVCSCVIAGSRSRRCKTSRASSTRQVTRPSQSSTAWSARRGSKLAFASAGS